MSIARRTATLLAALGATTLILAACGSDGGAESDATEAPDRPPASAAAPATTVAASTTVTPQLDLSGVTLRVGDQADNHLRSVLEGSGEAAEVPYKIEWSTFQNGPALIAAETGGSVDLGKLSETPLVFAQAAGSPVKVVYAGRPLDDSTSSLAVIVKSDSPLKSLADLKGKKVGYAQGTVLEYLLANALSSVDLTLQDVQLVNLQPGQDLLGRGDVDALVSGDPTMSVGLVGGANRILSSGAGFTPGYYYLTARDGALEDEKVSAAIGDFVQRLQKAETWYNENPDKAVELVVAATKVAPDVAQAIVERAPVVYGPIDDTILQAHQEEADFFFDLGVIKEQLDTKAVFDLRYGAEG